MALAILLGDGLDNDFTEPFDLVGVLTNERLPTPFCVVSSNVVPGFLAGELVVMGEPGGRESSS